MTPKNPRLTRRHFLAGATAAVSAFTVLPRHLLAASGQTPAGEKLNLAFVGVGGRGNDNLGGLSGQNVVALCDVDENRLGAAAQKHPQARRYRDYRIMLEEVDSSIDGVVVSTPDHTHAVAALAAIKRGKHVYCEKPLAHSIHEVRALIKAAQEHGVVTQMGNQGHSFDSIRTFCEWIRDGAIGKVHTIHAATSAFNSSLRQLEAVKQPQPVPPSLDWDLWLGPAASRPYHSAYQPGRWRGWVPFGSGSIGDWVCHVVDPVFWALDLGAPVSVQAQARNYDPAKQGDAHPPGTVATFEFPARDNRGPIQMIWYDGTEKPPRPAELEADDKGYDTGATVIGDQGTIIYGSHGAGGLRLIPDARMNAYQKPAKSLPRVKDHYQDWVDAVRKGAKAGSDFAYGGPLTELALLGNIAVKQLGQKLEWDGAKGRFTNSEAANTCLAPKFRDGWTL